MEGGDAGEEEKRWPEVRPDCGAAKVGTGGEWTPAEKKKEG